MKWTRIGLAPLLALVTGCNKADPVVDTESATDSQNETSTIDPNESAIEGQKLSFASFDRTPTAVEWGGSEDQFTKRLEAAQKELSFALSELDAVVEEYREALAAKVADDILEETYNAMYQARSKVEAGINSVLALPLKNHKLIDESCRLTDQAFAALLSSVTLLTSEDQERGCSIEKKVKEKRRVLEAARTTEAITEVTKN